MPLANCTAGDDVLLQGHKRCWSQYSHSGEKREARPCHTKALRPVMALPTIRFCI